MQSHLTRTIRTLRPLFYPALPVAIAILGIAMVDPAPAQERMLRTLSVTGQGVEHVQTTLADVTLGVDVQANSAVEAQQEAARRSQAVVNFLRSKDVERLQTTGINLSPRYNYSNDEQRLVGYTASNIVRFRVPIDQAGEILDEAVDAGATRIDGISFSAPDEAIATAQRQALREATDDAQAQASAVLDSLGLEAQDIVGIQINHAAPPPSPMMMNLRSDVAMEAAQSPVIGGEQDVNASVTLHIQY